MNKDENIDLNFFPTIDVPNESPLKIKGSWPTPKKEGNISFLQALKDSGFNIPEIKICAPVKVSFETVESTAVLQACRKIDEYFSSKICYNTPKEAYLSWRSIEKPSIARVNIGEVGYDFVKVRKFYSTYSFFKGMVYGRTYYCHYKKKLNGVSLESIQDEDKFKEIEGFYWIRWLKTEKGYRIDEFLEKESAAYVIQDNIINYVIYRLIERFIASGNDSDLVELERQSHNLALIAKSIREGMFLVIKEEDERRQEEEIKRKEEQWKRKEIQRQLGEEKLFFKDGKLRRIFIDGTDRTAEIIDAYNARVSNYTTHDFVKFNSNSTYYYEYGPGRVQYCLIDGTLKKVFFLCDQEITSAVSAYHFDREVNKYKVIYKEGFIGWYTEEELKVYWFDGINNTYQPPIMREI